MADEDALGRALAIARAYVASRDDRPVWPTATLDELRAALGGPLPATPIDPVNVIDALARAAEPGLVTTTGPRYFGFVTGGALPATVAAEWLAAAWDQNAALHVMSPAASVVEEIAGGWLLDLLNLPPASSVGFVTGCHMANFTALAAARHEMLRRAGWDVEAEGLQGAPPVRVIVGDEVHVSAMGALRYLGFGSKQVRRVDVDTQGRMLPEALAAALASGGGPTIVCAQAGNVNTGAFDPFETIVDLAHVHKAWVHVDGAFGLWAAASPALKHHVAGVDRADSWATDAHKWLNVPYDSGLVFVAHPAAHRAAMSQSAAYLTRSAGEPREAMDWVPESSRRARGFAIYAALRSLGRSGVADMIERCCRLARRFADRLGAEPSIRILNDVVLNQVLVRVEPPGGATQGFGPDAARGVSPNVARGVSPNVARGVSPNAARGVSPDVARGVSPNVARGVSPNVARGFSRAEVDADTATREALKRVQDERICWLGGTRWHGMDAMRISVSNWSTTDADVDLSADSIIRAVRQGS